jgi:hypothetical protein
MRRGGEPASRLRQHHERVRHGGGEEPFVAAEPVEPVVARFRPRPVGPHIRAALPLRHPMPIVAERFASGGRKLRS